jgi:hypothetical protein
MSELRRDSVETSPIQQPRQFITTGLQSQGLVLALEPTQCLAEKLQLGSDSTVLSQHGNEPVNM